MPAPTKQLSNEAITYLLALLLENLSAKRTPEGEGDLVTELFLAIGNRLDTENVISLPSRLIAAEDADVASEAGSFLEDLIRARHGLGSRL